ncbi:MAG: deoxyuridine 5'-triphosphate nucleotidohydrolase [Bacteroidetes bacterium MedPE-SWsnd-G2]|nr:MAG: deoxyuridine 5'-triphosphate nucleotidohydrolase [Bacteroidetes bacterium MedPE-SWsnd-G2]
MNFYKCLSVLLLGAVLVGCNPAKRVIGESGDLNTKMSAKQLIKQSEKSAPNFKTLQSKIKLEYTEGDKSQGYTLSFRMEKDNTIWVSAALGLVRAVITPEKVKYYDKINNQYFDGDYALLSDVLGTELDFFKVQNLLLGDAIFGLKNGNFKASTHEKSYVLEPRKQDPLFELFYLLNPSHFKMDSQELFQPLEKRMLDIDYTSYQNVDKEILPEHIRIVAVEEYQEVVIDLQFKSVSLNGPMHFPFKIPEGFKEIEIK